MLLFGLLLAVAAPAQGTALSGQQILDRATAVWESMPLAPYETFTLPCHELLPHGAEGSCGSSTKMRVYLRTGDGMAHVETVPTGGEPAVVLMPSGRIYGPAFAPLGFTRKIGASKHAGSLAADPLGNIKTIAAVTATNYAYDVSVEPGVCNASPAYHLTLTPRGSDTTHPLRALWVDEASFEVCRLTYAIAFEGGEASVQYDFEDRGDPPVASIVRIRAAVPSRFSGTRSVSEELTDIAFSDRLPGVGFNNKPGCAPPAASSRESTGEWNAVLAQLRAAAWPVSDVIPTTASSDLAPLGTAIGAASIVGLGEESHGTSEFFTLKDRIFRYLVENEGFTVLAMEANWSDALAIERYVTTGQGDVRAALAATFPVWNNQETLDLIEWMRAYNAAPGAHAILHFAGIDMQSPRAAARMVVAAFAKARPSERAAVAAEVHCMDSSIEAIYATAASSAHAACVRDTAQTVARFDSESSSLRAGLTQVEFVNARQAAVVVSEAALAYDGNGEDGASRDAAMARNAAWVEQVLYPGARVALWAHNAHVMTDSLCGTPTMGSTLRKTFGAGYYAVGFSFYRGGISPNGIAAPMQVGAPPPFSVDALLHDAGVSSPFGVNLRGIPVGSPFGRYLAADRPMRAIGAIDSPAELDDDLVGLVPSKAFDTLLFVDESHPARSFLP